jgi:anti-sigma B factor antagonist
MTTPAIERIDGIPIARPREDIDAASAPRTERLLADALGAGSSSLVVDLSDVRYLDSAGIDMLLRLSQRLEQRRAKLLLVIPAGSQLNRLMEIVGMPGTVPIHLTVSGALQAARAAPQRRAPSPEPDDSVVS